MQAIVQSRVWYLSPLMPYCFVHSSHVWICGYFSLHQLGQASAYVIRPLAAPVSRQSWVAHSHFLMCIITNYLIPFGRVFNAGLCCLVTKHQSYINTEKNTKNKCVFISNPCIDIYEKGVRDEYFLSRSSLKSLNAFINGIQPRRHL